MYHKFNFVNVLWKSATSFIIHYFLNKTTKLFYVINIFPKFPDSFNNKQYSIEILSYKNLLNFVWSVFSFNTVRIVLLVLGKCWSTQLLKAKTL